MADATHQGLSHSPSGAAAAVSTAARVPHRSPFYCSVCDVSFSDSHAADVHKASLKHKKKSGEWEWEERQYKKDADVTAADVWAVVRRKQVELDVRPWSELRWSADKCSTTADTKAGPTEGS